MTKDTIKWGETYDIAVQGGDADGVPFALDGTWSAAVRITRDRIGGPEVMFAEMTIAGGYATAPIDTRATGWQPGVYIWDVRLTDADGYDYWSEPNQLTLENRNTPDSSVPA